MKLILQSIKSQYCELIAAGKKTIEVRKTKPKLDVPFKVYIYQTKCRWLYRLLRKMKLDDLADRLSEFKGKVIGEYVCDDIVELEYDELEECYMFKNCYGGYIFDEILSDSCLSYDEIRKYGNGKPLYLWHISDLKIYDKPKELSEFTILCKEYDKDNPDCECCDYQSATCDCDTPPQFDCKCNGLKPLTRPPQSWCYVEEA